MCCLLLGAACSIGNKYAPGCCLLEPGMWVRGICNGKRPWWRGRDTREPQARAARGRPGRWPARRGDAGLGDDGARREWVGSWGGRLRRAHGKEAATCSREEACGARGQAAAWMESGGGGRRGSGMDRVGWRRLERVEWLGFPKKQIEVERSKFI